jgi:hypothetical protein
MPSHGLSSDKPTARSNSYLSGCPVLGVHSRPRSKVGQLSIGVDNLAGGGCPVYTASWSWSVKTEIPAYSFRASFKHPSFQMYGDLDFDWLGDISGEALAVFHERSGKAARDCDLLISGDYSLAKDPGVYSATLTLTPVAADCPINHGKSETLRVNIFRRNDRGDLDLIETSSSDHRLFGVATLQSPGPFWSLTYLQFGKGRNELL